jgi:hypothetical protein
MKTYVGVKVYLHLSRPRHYMEVSGQLHAPNALPRGKELHLPFGLEGKANNVRT